MPKEEKDKELAEALALINKKYGDGTLLSLTDNNQHHIATITTGVSSLDYILGGGVPKGRLMEIYGQEASGKTTLSLQMIAACQKDGKKAAYIDAENAFDPNYAKAMGVDMKNLFLNQPNSGEEALDIVEKLCKTNAFSIIVIDSVAALVPMAVEAKEIGGTANIGTTARMLSQALPRISNAAGHSETVLLFINQLRANIGVMYGDPFVTCGGKALKYACSVRLQISAMKPEERNGVEGCPVKVRVKKNKIAAPFRETELFLQFGKGFDIIGDLLETAIDLGIIKKSGGWYEYEGLKVQGQQSFFDAIKKDQKAFTKLMKEIKNQ